MVFGRREDYAGGSAIFGLRIELRRLSLGSKCLSKSYPKIMHLPTVTLANALDHCSFELDFLDSYECLKLKMRNDAVNLKSLCLEYFSLLPLSTFLFTMS